MALFNYSPTQGLKNLISPFTNLFKKPAAPLASPAPIPASPAPNTSTLQGPRYFAPPVMPQVKEAPPTGYVPGQYSALSGPSLTPGIAPSPTGVPTPKIPPAAPVTPRPPAGAPAGAPSAPVAPPAPVSAPVQPQTPQTEGTPQPAPFTPNPAQQAAISSAEAAYQRSLQLSPEELSTQEDLDRLSESARKAYTNVRDQAIPLEFITGQLASVERRALDLAEPLERKLARLQAARVSSTEASKFALERADKAADSARGEAKDIRTEAESARRFGITTGLTREQQAQQKLEADRKFEEDKRQFGLDYALKQRQLAMQESEAKAKAQQAVSPYQEERSIRTVQSVDELLAKAQASPGIFGRTAAAPIPKFLRSDAYRNFESELLTLKSSIFSGELTAMREASKTGGAVGNVSDREGDKLEAALGALDMSQSPENFQSQLQKIKESINRWREAVGAKPIGEAPPMFQLPDGTIVRLQPDGTYK